MGIMVIDNNVDEDDDDDNDDNIMMKMMITTIILILIIAIVIIIMMIITDADSPPIISSNPLGESSYSPAISSIIYEIPFVYISIWIFTNPPSVFLTLHPISFIGAHTRISFRDFI